MLLSKTEIINKFQSVINELNNYKLEIGVFTTTSKRKFRIGITNAQLMFIHENGSPLKNIPSRPVLQMTIDYAKKHLLKKTIHNCFQAAITGQSNIEQELQKLAMKMENYARKLIYNNDGRLIANAPSTIAKKGTNHPLFDTGQLARSITCRIIKE